MEHREEIDWSMFTDKEVGQMANPNQEQMNSPEFLGLAKEALDEHVRRRRTKEEKNNA